jgi:hypothetical protein
MFCALVISDYSRTRNARSRKFARVEHVSFRNVALLQRLEHDRAWEGFADRCWLSGETLAPSRKAGRTQQPIPGLQLLHADKWSIYRRHSWRDPKYRYNKTLDAVMWLQSPESSATWPYCLFCGRPKRTICMVCMWMRPWSLLIFSTA